jgi:hypothetical protein
MIRRLDRSEDFRTTILRLRGEWDPGCSAGGDAPRPEDDRGEYMEEITCWVSVPGRKAEPQGFVRKAAHWLFLKGGMCVVLILGMMLFPLIALALGFR